MMAVSEFCPDVDRTLRGLYSGRGTKRDVLDVWAARWNLTQGGRCPDWLATAAKWACEMPNPIILVPLSPPLPQINWPIQLSETILRLPSLRWHPFQPTELADGSVRVLTKRQAREMAMCAIDAELDRIEAAARAAGAKETPRKTEAVHFEWAVRFQVAGESMRAIAPRSKDPEHSERNVRYRVHEILKRVGLDVRRGRTGRPRKQ